MKYITRVLILAVLLLMVACLPVINRLTSDGRVLTYTSTGIRFDPLGEQAQSVLLDIQGSSIRIDSPFCAPYTRGYTCNMGNLDVPVNITIQAGANVTICASYVREITGLRQYCLGE